ncbi:MFS transporter [Telmatospirillum sp.]|uniref:MFS transporter n=1 Tax=Telmatospirillum sp. TaxID=2079197 RepID=UPI00284D3799|nr:MFS transporter [Telmatospirillum sp.]MDR3440019.1 MFS transporter [Telmatospirillum sp.]
MSGLRRSKILPVIQVASGNFLEMYDFMVFGYYASAIARAFFPSNSEFSSLMLSLMTFGAGFLMRPLGAIFLGSYIDHKGRRAGLLVTLGLMSIGTLSIACIPGYETIGFFAPILVVIGRLLQGFSAGVELGGVSVYLSEIATPGHKGFYVSWQSGSQQLAVVFTASLGVLLSSWLPPEQMTDWGWRIPLLVGCMIIPLIFLLRSSLKETEAFQSRRHHPRPSEIMRSVAANWRIVLTGVMMATMTTVAFYMITAYTPTFGKTLHLDSTDNLIVTLCVGLSNFCLLPIMGALSDKVGRRPLLIVFTCLALVSAYPAMSWLAEAPSFARLMTVELWLSFLYASYNGAMVVFLTEIMPIEVRTSGFSLAYSLATAIFGGFTPAICTYLIHVFDNRAMPGAWLSFAAVCGLVAALSTGRHERMAQAERAQPAK